MSDGSLVELHDVRKAFGDNVVLDGVDLDVARGEVIVIAGPSGSGKSTLLRCVNGLEPIDRGEIRFDGRPVRPGKGLPALRAQIGLVFQQFNLFPHMSVLDNITLAPIRVKGVPHSQAQETARRLLERHPDATLVGIDASATMLDAARGVLLADRVELRVGRLEHPLPKGPFDRVVSVLAVHHLDGPGKADLFRRIAAIVEPGGRFVLGDVVVPDDPADAITPIDGVYDKPSRVDDQLRWLADAGFEASVVWQERDLAVVRAEYVRVS
jgi:SAM-dependent methyltransferase